MCNSTQQPTRKPTVAPTKKPTSKPTETPTNKPTPKPSPTRKPTNKPTRKPTNQPTPTLPCQDVPVTVVISVSDDATIYKDQPDENFGSTMSLKIDSDDGVREALLKFDTSVIGGRNVESAEIRLYSTKSSDSGGRLMATDEYSWNEETVTWNNAPSCDDSNYLGTIDEIVENSWNSLDVTAAVSSDRPLSIRIRTDSTIRGIYSSKENPTGYASQLVVVLSPDCDAPTIAPTRCSDIDLGDGPTVYTFQPTDDATIQANTPNTNYGGAHDLKIDYDSGIQEFLLRFDPSSVSLTSSVRAMLRLFCIDGSPHGGHFVTTSSMWDEETVTWDNAPLADGIQLGSLERVVAGNWYTLDVTAGFVGSSPLSIRVNSGDAMGNRGIYCSKETPNCFAPELIVVPTDSITMIPSDDATIYLQQPNTNYGLDPILKVESDAPTYNTLIRFDTSAIGPREVTRAVLRLYATDESIAGGEVIETSDFSWNENSVTWSNAPDADGDALGMIGTTLAGHWYEIDVTSAVISAAAHPFSIRIISEDPDRAEYSSKEHANENAPQLVVRFCDDAPTRRPTRAPTKKPSPKPSNGPSPKPTTRSPTPIPTRKPTGGEGPSQCAAYGSLGPNEMLGLGEFLCVGDGRFGLNENGKVSYYIGDNLVWVAENQTPNTVARSLVMQSDGNLVAYDATAPPRIAVWASNWGSSKPYKKREKIPDSTLSFGCDGPWVVSPDGDVHWELAIEGDSEAPTDGPTNSPTDAPTKVPTEAPNKAPTRRPTPKPTAPSGGCVVWGSMGPGDVLYTGQFLCFEDSRFGLNDDGKVTYYIGNELQWIAKNQTPNAVGRVLIMQSDGNLVAYDAPTNPKTAVWASNWSSSVPYKKQEKIPNSVLHCGSDGPSVTGPGGEVHWMVTIDDATTPATIILSPSDDATIHEQEEFTNYGFEPNLVVDLDSGVHNSLLRFDTSVVGSFCGVVEQAVLQMYAIEGSQSGGIFIKTSSSSWDEAFVTWNNAPDGDDFLLGYLGEVQAESWYELDIAPSFLDGSPLSIRISSPHSNKAEYSSKENPNGNGPRLAVILGPPPPGVLMLLPTDDATVYYKEEAKNFGHEPELKIDADSGVHDSLLRFDVSCVNEGSVTNAVLRLFATDPSPHGGTFVVTAHTAWTEETVTWDSAPESSGMVLNALDRIDAGRWYEVNVTPAVVGGSAVSIRIDSAHSNRGAFASKEHPSGMAPQLIVEHM